VQLFRDVRQFKLFIMLSLSTLFCLSLIGVRLHHLHIHLEDITNSTDYYMLRGTSTFFFLIWNLFLAWIPYGLALCIDKVHQQFSSRVLTLGCLFVWLLFLPNAPYLITDLVHLKWRSPIPYWYDIMLFVSFAWTGLLLCLVSLFEIHFFLRKHLAKRWSWPILLSVIFLTGVGVYIGRFLRWNSWDILTQPISLIKDLIQLLTAPGSFPGSGSVIVLSVFITLAYLTFISLGEPFKKSR